MRFLPLKLGIAVVLLFAAVITTCLLWTPVKIRYYVGKLKSNDPKGRVAAVEKLLEMGRKGADALAEILDGGETEAEFLSKYWDNFNERINRADMLYCYPLHLAATEAYPDAAKLLIAKGADLNVRDAAQRTPLHIAVIYGHEEMVKLLISNGAVIELDSKKGGTPLYHAVCAAKCNMQITKILLKSGANINSIGYGEYTPYDRAVVAGREEIADLLRAHGGMTRKELFEKEILEKSANVNAAIGNGVTLLHGASYLGYEDLVALLIEKGADVKAKTRDGETPLHTAAERSNENIASLLISKGADVNAINSYDETPLDGALQHGCKEIIKLLRSHGAKTGEKLKNESSVKSQGSSVKEKKK